MLELSAENAAEYLNGAGMGSGPWRVIELGGGVSNTVLLVESEAGRFVLKQALGKLRVEQDWFSDRRRILRESGAMRALKPHLPPGAVPEVIFEDETNLIYAMSAAPAGAQSWKELLLAGEIDLEIAVQIGRMLASMVRISWKQPRWESEFGDQTVFDQLRIDPYYRSTAVQHPDLAAQFGHLMRESGARRVSLVHGDWSPKNFLVSRGAVMAIDFEVIHYGDPAFDSAFLLNHLVLKTFYRPEWGGRLSLAAGRFWDAYTSGLPAGSDWIESATLQHLGGLLLARIDGKSPAEYLKNPAMRERIRQFARNLMLCPPDTIEQVFQSIC